MGCGVHLLLSIFFTFGSVTALALVELVREYSRDRLVEAAIWLPILHILPAGIYVGILISIRRQEVKGLNKDAGGLSTGVWRFLPAVVYIVGVASVIVLALIGVF
ncbi:MAG: hypothetical protein O7H41_05220 [Planctomycetota bacterium]|nr:hypothetical protein [Planctomycetota bacterium]